MSISSLTQKVQLAKVSGAKTAQILGLLTRTEKTLAILLYGVCFVSCLFIFDDERGALSTFHGIFRRIKNYFRLGITRNYLLERRHNMEDFQEVGQSDSL